MSELKEIEKESYDAVKEIIDKAGLKAGDIFVVGCSSSEVLGQKIGTNTSVDVAKVLYAGISKALDEKGVFLAAQCCEHLNRAIITSRTVAEKQMRDVVNVVPQPKAGGSFATITYNTIPDAVAVEHITADAGIDIGGVLIGMHLREVAVPLNLKNNMIGKAHITAARTRPKFIGGERAHYDDSMK